jgi:uncharacterized membrane protein YozB (DUF420 family)
VAPSFPIRGFLGTGATFAADLNLVVQFVMGAALTAGVLLAKRKWYRAHGICQTTVLLLNLLMIGLVMWPTFRQQVKPTLPKVLHKWYFAAPTIHAVLGMTAELLGLYIVVVGLWVSTSSVGQLSALFSQRPIRRSATDQSEGTVNFIRSLVLPFLY